MTRQTMSEIHDCNGDAAAYVLGALEPHEAEAFRRHVATCVVCRDEVTAFQQVADALPAAAPQYRAPKDLRRRVVTAVRAEPRGAAAEAPAARRRRPFFSGSFLAPPALAGAAAGLAAVIVAIVLITSGGSSSRLIQASVGNAELRVSGGSAELIVRKLPPPPPGHIYQVWVQRGDRPPSPTRALFSVTSGGASDVGVPGSVKGVNAVLVTPEPNGGSLAPTHTPVIVARLT